MQSQLYPSLLYDIISLKEGIMNKKVKSSFITFFSVIVIILLWGFNINSFITGPVNINNYKDRQILNEMLDKYLYLEGNLLYRYSNEEVSYVAKVNIEGDDYLVWYDVNSSVLYKDLLTSLKNEEMLKLAYTEYPLEKPTIILGYCKHQPVYVIYDKNVEIRYSYLTKELLSIYYKEVQL